MASFGHAAQQRSAVDSSDGLRRPRRGRRCSRPIPITTARGRCSPTPSRPSVRPTRRTGVAVATGPAVLRQRHPRRGVRRRRARPPAAPRSWPTAASCSPGCSTGRRVDGHLSPTPAGGAGPADAARSLRPATDRGRGDGRRLRPSRGRHRRPPLGTGRRPRHRMVPRRQRRWTLRCGIRPAAAATTACTPPVPTCNQGAESTLALLSTLQHARGTALVPVIGRRAGGPPTAPPRADPSPRHRQAVRARPPRGPERTAGLRRRRPRPRPRRRGGRAPASPSCSIAVRWPPPRPR